MSLPMHFCPNHEGMYNGDRFPAPTNGCMCDHADCAKGASVTVMVKSSAPELKHSCAKQCRFCDEPAFVPASYANSMSMSWMVKNMCQQCIDRAQEELKKAILV